MHTPKVPLRLLPLLICLAALLCLATTCGDDEYIYDTGMKVVSVWLTVAGEAGEYRESSSPKEETQTKTAETLDEKDYCGTNSLMEEESMAETTENTAERRHEVRLKYDPLFWRQPNVYAVSEGFLRDGRGGWTEDRGINVLVTKKVDQSTLPPSDRIPDCLEGIPVKITEEPNTGEIIPLWVPPEFLPKDTEEEQNNGSD